MDEGKYLADIKDLFNHYSKDEVNRLLWDMYKGWFLHSATEIDSDKMIDMLLFYEELKNLFADISASDPEIL